jgi:hypothetical protein
MNAAHVKVVTIEDLEVTTGSHLGSGVNTYSYMLRGQGHHSHISTFFEELFF